MLFVIALFIFFSSLIQFHLSHCEYIHPTILSIILECFYWHHVMNFLLLRWAVLVENGVDFVDGLVDWILDSYCFSRKMCLYRGLVMSPTYFGINFTKNYKHFHNSLWTPSNMRLKSLNLLNLLPPSYSIVFMYAMMWQMYIHVE